MKNAYTIINVTDNTEVKTLFSIPAAIATTREICKTEENAGKEFLIKKNDGSIVLEVVSAKQNTGKLVMMLKDVYLTSKERSAKVAANREAHKIEVECRKQARAEKRQQMQIALEIRGKVKLDNAKVAEIYNQMKAIHDEAKRKKNSFLKAFKTVQSKEREQIAALKIELKKILSEKQESKKALNIQPNLDVNAIAEITETAC